ncbi:MAG: cadherin-like domain-containing protein [Amphritea sp.]|nr:cadherin-like domain-containing protein [Amphritea sp.]MBQ0783699.1 cadherin-like domain-containing protein [Amphritea sp.]
MALLKSAVPGATVAQLEQVINETAADIDTLGPDNNTGYGLVDAQAAYLRLLELTIPANAVPIGVADEYNVKESSKLRVSSRNGLLSNDIDADHDSLTAHLVRLPKKGRLRLKSNGSFIYKHKKDAHTDTFVYVVSDGQAYSEEITVTLNIIDDDKENSPPLALKDVIRVKKNTSSILAVLANDKDSDGNIDPSTVKIVRKPNKRGKVSVNEDGTIVYKPAKGFRGREVFEYRVWDKMEKRSNAARVVLRVK